ncbi:hypothetical protein [Salinibaculum salinum]|uniref:hypothetical protein n=1 Tax=Salinibaculum salinum TaxID=3131996 RepID=UPI0030EDA794
MRINLDDRLDKEYPERSNCEVNDRDCDYDVDTVCHNCGTKMCDACSIGVRHQPRLSKYTRNVEEGTERFERHCPDCIDEHTLNMRNLGIGGGMGLFGALLAYIGVPDTPVLAVFGLFLLVAGALVLRTEYRLKTRRNENYGFMSLW